MVLPLLTLRIRSGESVVLGVGSFAIQVLFSTVFTRIRFACSDVGGNG